VSNTHVTRGVGGWVHAMLKHSLQCFTPYTLPYLCNLYFKSQLVLVAGEQLAVQAGVLKRIAPHFPARAPAVPPPAPLRAALVFLNLSAARLLSRVLPEAPQGPLGFAAPGQQEAAWVQRLVAFYVGVLRDGSALPSE